jgi:hypothetical protein
MRVTLHIVQRKKVTRAVKTVQNVQKRVSEASLNGITLVDMGNPSLDVSGNTLGGQADFAEAVSL